MDFTNNPIDKSKVYGGKNGNKIAILINNEPYMLKKRHELILVPALSRIKKNELLNTVAPLKISLSKPKERGGLER